jgi:hypothetical protein
MKLLDLNLNQVRKEFGARLITLNSGKAGLRGGMACTVKDVEGNDPVMEFIGSDGSIDRYNEVIDQGGWQLENFRANPVIPDCHDYSSIGKILGRADSVDVVNGQLVNRVRFCLDNPLGLIAYKMAKGGFVNSQSVGFIPLEWTNGNAAGQPDRTYTGYYTRRVSGTDGSSETDYMIPDPLVNDLIYALPCSTAIDNVPTPKAVYSVVMVNSGTSGTYAINDILTCVGGTFTTPATIKVLGASAGKILTVELYNSGVYTVNPTLTNNAATGGGGTGALFNLTMAPQLLDLNIDARAWMK